MDEAELNTKNSSNSIPTTTSVTQQINSLVGGCEGSHDDSRLTESNKVTNKTMQYLNDEIVDRNGNYSYLDDPNEYKKARKRQQNRESAVRSRMRKKNFQDDLEGQVTRLAALVEKLNKDKKELKEKNMRLIAENENLKQ